MNKLHLVAVSIAMLLVAGAWAQETDPSADITRDWAEQEAQRAENQARMDELMGTMNAEMVAIRASTNRKDRQALMTEHRAHMLEAMSLMRGMNGMHMRKAMAGHAGSGMKHAMGMNNKQHMSKDMAAPTQHSGMKTEDRIRDLEIRIDMMSIMMESMMQDGSN
mgnify:FL=1|jgi:HSP90 family molecular chaperone